MFSIGDEVVCVNDTNLKGLIVKGQVYIVLAVWPVGTEIGTTSFGPMKTCESVSIGVGVENAILVDELRMLCPCASFVITDIWVADRFRKIERKRTREELHALIGISDMLGERAPELV